MKPLFYLKKKMIKTNKRYSIIYADPPWQYKTKECLGEKSILNGTLDFHYNTLSLKQIMKLNVQNISDDNCLLFLWVVSPMFDDGIKVMKYWGFKYATVAFVWYKQRSNPGHYTMSECELCLVGKKGKIPYPRGAKNIRQFLSEKRTNHSVKPNEIRNRIYQMFPTQNKIELFARQKINGWDTFGNEVENSIDF